MDTRLAMLQGAQLATSAKEVKLVLKVGARAKPKKALAPKAKASVTGQSHCCMIGRMTELTLLNSQRKSA